MGLSLLDADDAFLAGKTIFDAWQEEFDREWIEPMAREVILPTLMMMLPPQIHQMLKRDAPAAYKGVMERIGKHG